MQGFWKQLDDMSTSDKTGYDDFIKKQMGEHKEWEAEQRKEREKQRIITGTPLCTLKILVSKILAPKKEQNLSESIKLFDFDQNAELNMNIVESQDQAEKALE